jgi:tRNA(Arg) A34 adenosine deaminase TadA
MSGIAGSAPSFSFSPILMNPTNLMELAIGQCRKGIAAGQSPFGNAIALSDRVILSAHNTVVLTTDITAHAEMNAIRLACQEGAIQRYSRKALSCIFIGNCRYFALLASLEGFNVSK